MGYIIFKSKAYGVLGIMGEKIFDDEKFWHLFKAIIQKGDTVNVYPLSDIEYEARRADSFLNDIPHKLYAKETLLSEYVQKCCGVYGILNQREINNVEDTISNGFK